MTLAWGIALQISALGDVVHLFIYLLYKRSLKWEHLPCFMIDLARISGPPPFLTSHIRFHLKNWWKTSPAPGGAFSMATDRSLDFAVCWVSHICIEDSYCSSSRNNRLYGIQVSLVFLTVNFYKNYFFELKFLMRTLQSSSSKSLLSEQAKTLEETYYSWQNEQEVSPRCIRLTQCTLSSKDRLLAAE